MPYDDSKMPFYALGTNLALQVGAQGNLKTLLDEDELEIVLDAFTQTLKGTALVEPRTILSHYGPPLNALLSERNSRLTERIQKDGAEYIRKFLECSPEAMQTSSGLVYYEMTAGTGKQPTIKDSVEVHYHGSLTDGTVFDSSVERGQTITFPLSGVIKVSIVKRICIVELWSTVLLRKMQCGSCTKQELTVHVAFLSCAFRAGPKACN
jgi:FKBP-type peptidyl-prolyl cis-trans isomerase FklB